MKDASGHVIDPTSHAEKLASISGDHVAPGVLTSLFNNHGTQGPLTRIFYSSTETLRDHVADATAEILIRSIRRRERLIARNHSRRLRRAHSAEGGGLARWRAMGWRAYIRKCIIEVFIRRYIK
jgi:hypothetical protein